MHAGQSVAVVVPALNEEASIAEVVRGFRALAAVDHVLVVDNRSRDRTAERARAAGALVVAETRPGYGAALRSGIGSALELGAGIVVLVEADGTFDPADLARLLAALEGCDLALGSRSAELHGALALGNRAVARLLAALWWRSWRSRSPIRPSSSRILRGSASIRSTSIRSASRSTLRSVTRST